MRRVEFDPRVLLPRAISARRSVLHSGQSALAVNSEDAAADFHHEMPVWADDSSKDAPLRVVGARAPSCGDDAGRKGGGEHGHEDREAGMGPVARGLAWRTMGSATMAEGRHL